MALELDAAVTLRETTKKARGWLIDVAAPLWAAGGRTESGLFAERMTLDGVADARYFRCFVQARHVFSFVAAGSMGWEGPWQTLVSETIDLLFANARRRDGFYVHRMDLNGAPLDGRADLYDQAFMLLALGTAGGALDRQDLFDAAESLLDTLEAQWSHPMGGYTEGEVVDASLRRQNPHMHLFEAFLALAEKSGRQRFWDAAVAIASMAEQHFIDTETGALREYFTQDWMPLGLGRRRDGDIIEPGHCSEWAWLFERLAAKGWAEGVRVSDGLVNFARSYGIDSARGVMIDEVWLDGTVKSARARLWPQTERAKAATVRWQRLHSAVEAQEAVAAIVGLEQYLAVDVPGLWRDKLNEDGSWVEELAPGSSLYHIACAIAELTTASTFVNEIDQRSALESFDVSCDRS
jgi:mannose/cellobiose epimerase-like protein (N-acyl-D-glucosamine 2-epimerase family)